MPQPSTQTSRAKRGLSATCSSIKSLLYQLDNPIAHQTLQPEPQSPKTTDASSPTAKSRRSRSGGLGGQPTQTTEHHPREHLHQPATFPFTEILPESHTVELDGRTSVLWVVDLKFVIAGDVVHSHVHQYLVEANAKELRLESIAALKAVVAGHKRFGGLDGAADVHASIVYIKGFQAQVDGGVREQEDLYQKVMEEYAGRVNSCALAGGCLKAVRNLE